MSTSLPGRIGQWVLSKCLLELWAGRKPRVGVGKLGGEDMGDPLEVGASGDCIRCSVSELGNETLRNLEKW